MAVPTSFSGEGSSRPPPLPPRIGARQGLSLTEATHAVTGPFEERLAAFLDLLYSDARRAGVVGQAHAQVLFRQWLELSQLYDPNNDVGLAAYYHALAALYPVPGSLKRGAVDDSFTRRQAEGAMRAPFEVLLTGYLRRLDDPRRAPGIRDVRHARDTFVTYCGLVTQFQPARGGK